MEVCTNSTCVRTIDSYNIIYVQCATRGEQLRNNAALSRRRPVPSPRRTHRGGAKIKVTYYYRY